MPTLWCIVVKLTSVKSWYRSEEISSADGKVIGWQSVWRPGWLVGCSYCWQRYRLSRLLTHKHNEPPVLLPSQTNLNLSAGTASLKQEMPVKLLWVKHPPSPIRCLIFFTRELSRYTSSPVLMLPKITVISPFLWSVDMTLLCCHHP